jgi:hypothetical protein
VNRVRRERRQAHGDVFGASGKWRGIAYPFSAMRDDGLARRNIHLAMLMLDAQRSAQHHGVFIKIGSLPRFLPAFGAAHVSHTEAAGVRVDATHIPR